MAIYQAEFGPAERMHHKKRVEFRDDATPKDAHPPLQYYSYDDSHVFVTDKRIAPDVFLALFDEVRRSVTQKVGAGLLPKRGPLIEGRITIQDDARGDTPSETFERLEMPLRLDRILRAFGRNAHHAVSSIRIDMAHFSMTFEGDKSTFSTAYPLVEEATLFAQRLSRLVDRQAIMKAAIQVVMDTNPVRAPELLRLVEGIRADTTPA